MSWLLLSIVVVMGFLLLKVRRRRKVRQAAGSHAYTDSKAA